MSEMILQRGRVDETPELVGYDSSRVEALNEHLWRMIDDHRLMGASYCIAKDDKVIANNALGYSSFRRDKEKLMMPDTVMSTASVTKIVTVVAIFKLVEDGFIRPDEKMSMYIPQMDAEQPFKDITIAQVLSHSSGFPFATDEKNNPFAYIEKCKRGDDWIEAGLKAGVSCKPGEQWQYSSFGYVLLGALIGNVTGIRAEDYITRNILEPLGMKDSSFRPGPELGRRHLVQFEDHEKRVSDMINGTSNSEDEDSIWIDVPQTAGGLHSTAMDLIKFARMLCNGGRLGNTRILGKMAIEKMRTQYLFNVPDYCWGANNKNRLYGMGPDLRRGDAIITSPDFFFHEGWGYLSVVIDPREKLCAVWLVPYTDGNVWYPESLLNVKNVIWSGLI
ncbi:MAG: beta-lactamase family protein [Clostridiales bacterium]|jgi:CubicO group peptidase (beta-lactamase class C family)|nr:beta-lactamase family protein [Clostridiales bacterium]